MPGQSVGAANHQAADQVLGYLNFSSGSWEPSFLIELDRVWRQVSPPVGTDHWLAVVQALEWRLEFLSRQSATFRDVSQVTAVLRLARDQVLPGYLGFHAELLFHQSADGIVNSFFLGRVLQAALGAGGGDGGCDADAVVAAVIDRLSDFVGYRPVPVLETREKVEPYPRERVGVVPLYLRGVGTAPGRYEAVVQKAWEILRETDADLLRAAHFAPELLDELAFDPRAYDFDHPVNKRPNYHFGQWDPHRLDQQGRYRRYVVQQVTLEALTSRLNHTDVPPDELLFEAAAVLAGTVLMGAGISGSAPGAHDSTVTLSNLLPRIAGYRDAFYERLMSRTSTAHAERLYQEAAERRQPFGAARQDLNAQLARRRASQLEHVHLAKIFARMGYPEAAAHEAHVVPATSARMTCQIDNLLTETRQALNTKRTAHAADLLERVTALIRQAIQCGALIDPWNILGFDAQFSLFPSVENSVHDHRADELVELMDRSFAMYSRLWSEAAARDERDLCQRIDAAFAGLAQWWRQFAAHEVSQVEAVDPAEYYQAARHVAEALNVWHRGGAAAGDIGFWAPHAEMFDSPQAYALVIDVLLRQSDFVASRGLLVHWLSQAQRVPLEQPGSSFFQLAERWLFQFHGDCRARGTGHELPIDFWLAMRKYLDYLEANADEYWHPPQFELDGAAGRKPTAADWGDEPPGEDDLVDDADDVYGAAYENVVFRDSTDDGVEGSLFETGTEHSHDELTREVERVSERLAFLGTMARMWRFTALVRVPADCQREFRGAVERWLAALHGHDRGLHELLATVAAYPLPRTRGDHDSLIEYDRQRVIKESLLDRIINTMVEVNDARRLLRAAIRDFGVPSQVDEESLVAQLISAALTGNASFARDVIGDLLLALRKKPLLYVPLNRGGKTVEIVAARSLQRALQDLLRCLPRLGLFEETCKLIEAAREMERLNPVGAGAVTEFDELFEIGYQALVQSLVDSACEWGEERDVSPAQESTLVRYLEQLTDAALVSWLAHSQTLRLSVLEKVSEKRHWTKLVEFIERYGGELFTQRFLNLGNVRAILHQTADAWFTQLQESEECELRLIEELDVAIPREEAAGLLTLILEAIVENYAEYRDYNSTTTQSDRGELLYCLLDFLRLRTQYDRICWNLRPVVLAHEILVRRGCKRAAQLWRRALRGRVADEAERFVERLTALQKKYAMQMPSIADRIGERFMRPLVIDRLCALVGPAMQEATLPGAKPTFRMLQYETEFLTKEPSGVGFDVPAWLVALDEEAAVHENPLPERDLSDDLIALIPAVRLSRREAQQRVKQWKFD